MSIFAIFSAPPDVEFRNFRQENGENLKKAWDRLSAAHKRVMPWIPVKIVLRNFYHGLFRWCNVTPSVSSNSNHFANEISLGFASH